MKEQALEYLVCPECRGRLELNVALSRVGDEVKEGILTCRQCARSHPVIDFVPILSNNPALLAEPMRALLHDWRHVPGIEKLGAVSFDGHPNRQMLAQTQRDHFAAEGERYDSEITDAPFWQAVQNLTIVPWGRKMAGLQGELLEVGCGTGRSTVELVRMGFHVVATDLCLEVVRLARAKILQTDPELKGADFVVCEAEVLPFVPERFSAGVFTGVLHHVAEPERVLSEMSRVMSAGAALYGYENNTSAFRFIFDMLMTLKRLWHEEAGPQPTLNGKSVKEWAVKNGFDICTKSAFFLPPHCFTHASAGFAGKILERSNGFFGVLPWVRDQGGLLIIEGVKKA